MPTTNSNIRFKHGLQETFSNITKDSNTIYFITDTNRLYIGDSEYTRPVQHGTEVPTSKNPANSLFVKETGTARELYYSKDGTAWDMIAYLPATITGGVFGNNTTGTVAYGGTVKVPKVTVDNRGYVTAAEDVTLTLPASDKVTTVTTSGDGNAVTGGSISADGATLTLTKGTSFMPTAGGTFTGAVTLAGAPTTDLNATTKRYVDDSISSAVSASDAMVFKGTVGTSGTAASFSAINVSSATKGDTYKVITADTLPAASSFDSTAHDLTPGDLIVYMGESKFIYVPSGDEDVTSVKVAGSGDTINVSTTAQTGTVVLGDVATKKASTSTTLNGNGASNDNVATELAVKTYVDDTVGALENTLGTAATTNATDYATAAQGTKADNAMPKSGGTFTGAVTLAGAPTTDLNAATKKYVDDLVDGYELKGNINSQTDVEDLYVYNPPFVTERHFKKGDMYEIKSNHIYIPSQISAESNTDAFYVNKGDLIFAVSDMGFIHISSSTLYIRGTIGTNGTFNNFESMYDTSGPTIIDTEYVSGDIFSINSDLTLPEEISFNEQEIALKYGDVILALPGSKFIKINDSDTITSIKIADIGDIINVSTIARSGEIILGSAAGVNTTSTVTNDATTVPTTSAVKTYVDDAVTAATLTWKTF